MGRVFWIKSTPNLLVASYLKKRGLIIDFETFGDTLVLVVGRRSEIRKSDIVRALRGYYGKRAEEVVEQAWPTLFLNVSGLRVEQDDEVARLYDSRRGRIVSFRVDEKVYAKLKKLAEESGESVSELVRKWVEERVG